MLIKSLIILASVSIGANVYLGYIAHKYRYDNIYMSHAITNIVMKVLKICREKDIDPASLNIDANDKRILIKGFEDETKSE